MVTVDSRYASDILLDGVDCDCDGIKTAESLHPRWWTLNLRQRIDTCIEEAER